MRTRVPVTGTRVWCHQAESRDHSLVSRARNQHFNSNCHRFKSVNYLAIHCNRGKTKDKRSSASVLILNLYSLILGMILSVKWLNDRRALLSDCWYWNIFVRSLRQAASLGRAAPVSRPRPRNMEHLQDTWSCPGPRLLLGRAWRPGQLHHGQGASSAQLCLRFYGQVLVGNWQELSQFIR